MWWAAGAVFNESGESQSGYGFDTGVYDVGEGTMTIPLTRALRGKLLAEGQIIASYVVDFDWIGDDGYPSRDGIRTTLQNETIDGINYISGCTVIFPVEPASNYIVRLGRLVPQVNNEFQGF